MAQEEEKISTDTSRSRARTFSKESLGRTEKYNFLLFVFLDEQKQGSSYLLVPQLITFLQ